MTNTPIKNVKLDVAFDACTPFVKALDMAIVEAEENLRKLNLVRSIVKSDLLGENFKGLSSALDRAGPPLASMPDNSAMKGFENAS